MSFHQTGAHEAPVGSLAHALHIVLSGEIASPDVLEIVATETANLSNATELTNPRLIPACVRLLEHYHSDTPDSGMSEGGTLCLCIIHLSLRLIMMQYHSTALPRLFTNPPSSVSKDTNPLHGILRNHIDWYENHTAANSPPSISVPGLSLADAATLLDWLYKERFTLLLERFAASGKTDDLSILLYGIWAHLRSKRILDCEFAEAKLHDLVCRFTSVKSDDEEDLLLLSLVLTTKDLVAISNHSEDSLKDHDPVTPDSLSDSGFTIYVYTTRIAEAPPPLDASLVLMDWAAGFTCRGIIGPVILVLEASYERLWMSLDPSKDGVQLTPCQVSGTLGYANRLLQHTRKGLEWPIMGPGPGMITMDVLVKCLCRVDIFAVLARALFCGATVGWDVSDWDTVRSAYDLLLPQIIRLRDSCLQRCGSHLSYFDKSHSDWLKPMIYMQEGCRTLSQDSPIHAHISKILSTWTGLGAVFRNAPRVHTAACSYPRCPYPVLIGKSGCHGCESTKGCRRLQWSEHMHRGSRS